MSDEKPCLHCMVHELIDKHFSTKVGEIREINTVEILSDLLDVMAEVIASEERSGGRQVHIEQITKRLPQLVADLIACTAEEGATRH